MGFLFLRSFTTAQRIIAALARFGWLNNLIFQTSNSTRTPRTSQAGKRMTQNGRSLSALVDRIAKSVDAAVFPLLGMPETAPTQIPRPPNRPRRPRRIPTRAQFHQHPRRLEGCYCLQRRLGGSTNSHLHRRFPHQDSGSTSLQGRHTTAQPTLPLKPVSAT